MGADIYDWDRVHGKGSYAAMANAQDKPTAPLLLAALEAALQLADHYLECARDLYAVADKVAAEDPRLVSHGAGPRTRAMAYEECARALREVITAALSGMVSS